VVQLQGHIDAFIAAYNYDAVPFVWTKKRQTTALQKSPYQQSVSPGTSLDGRSQRSTASTAT
jgi:hypothetical protein